MFGEPVKWGGVGRCSGMGGTGWFRIRGVGVYRGYKTCGSSRHAFYVSYSRGLNSRVDRHRRGRITRRVSTSARGLCGHSGPLCISVFSGVINVNYVVSFVTLVILTVFFVKASGLRLIVYNTMFNMLNTISTLVPDVA